MKKFRLIICLAVLATCFSCRQKFTENWELALDRESVTVSSTAESLPITVYASGDWTAELVEGTDWATLDQSSGKGVTTIHLVFNPNDGMVRKACVLVRSAGLERELPVTQNSGVKLPKVAFSREQVSLPGGSFDVELALDTNIPDRYFEGFVPETVDVSGHGTDWISGLSVSEPSGTQESSIPDAVRRTLKFRVGSNKTSEERKLEFRIKASNGPDEEYPASFTLVQSSEGIYINAPETVPVAVIGGTVEFDVRTNLGDFLEDLDIEVSYPGEHKDFITDIEAAAGKVSFSVPSRNDSPSDKRRAEISLTYTDAEGTVTQRLVKVAQNCDVQSFSGFTVEGADDLLLWNTSVAKWTSDDKITLAEDIDLTGASWTVNDFAGEFDGAGHTIRGLNAAAFIGTLTGKVKNLVLEGSIYLPALDASMNYCAPVLHLAGSGSIDQLVNKASVSVCPGTISSGTLAVGGICAHSTSSGSVTNCRNEGEIRFTTSGWHLYAGGIIGWIETGPLAMVSGCRNTGDIIFEGDWNDFSFVGGIVGNASIGLTATGCRNEGDIISKGNSKYHYLAGIAGNLTGGDGSVTDCFNGGNILSSGTNSKGDGIRIGGILGATNPGSGKWTAIERCECRSDISVTSSLTVNHCVGGILGYSSGGSAKVTDCKFKGTVSSESSGNALLGAIVGSARFNKKLTVDNNGAAGSVAGKILDESNYSSYLYTLYSGAVVVVNTPNYFLNE